MDKTATEMQDILYKERVESYNSGIDTAISLVTEVLKYDAPELLGTIVCGLENSKK